MRKLEGIKNRIILLVILLHHLCQLLGEIGRNCGLLGKKQDNPLLLLGQYSDEELDDEAGEILKVAVDACCSMRPDDKAKEHVVASENFGSNKDEVIEGTSSKQEADQVGTPMELNANDARDIENDSVDVENCENLIAQAFVSEPSESLVNGHINGHWKLVLHEQSNQYYYWNTLTGETSWEVPAALAVDSQNTDEQSVPATIEETVNSVEAHTFPNGNNEMAMYTQVSGTGGCQSSDIVNKDTGGYENMEFKSRSFYDINLSIGQHNTDNVTASHGNLSEYSSLSEPQTAPVRLHHPLDYEEKDEDHPSRQSDSYGTYSGEDAHSSQLVKYAEVLSQKLDRLYRSAQQLEGYEGIRKELDIRISDCKALSSYGSSLLPLWWHIEAQLKQIEFAINKIETSELFQSENFSNMAARQKAPKDSGHLEVIEKNHIIIDTSGTGSVMTGNENARVESTTKIEFEPQGNDHQPEEVPEANLLPDSAMAAPTMIHYAEDDMDVEMEVDDESSSVPTIVSFSTTVCPSPAEQLVQNNLPSSQCPSLTSDESNVPPPPEEEWIPPPPPEGEPFPPPPPPESEMDLPPEEPTAPFPYTETVPYPYPDQYNVVYSIPAYDSYSSSVAEVSNGSYYGNAGGSQLTESETHAYYDPLAASALAEVTLGVGPYGSATYYDISGAVVSSGPVYGNREPSEFCVESGAVNFKDVALATNLSSAAKLSVDSVGSCLPKVSRESQTSTLKASTILSTSQASGASSGNGSSFDTQPPAVTMNQSKVVRTKKRAVAVAPTLRSNKKVSSLVDKWKAAKEELHGDDDDDEPENPLEILEKKRHKEIEEWCARQVATGGAQDNANFVPLGGDWRERVKRRRKTQLKAEDAQTSTVLVEKEKKQLDLDEFSNDLPPGWQAYWDDSTKQVYYGNQNTSETTWTRPTR